MPSVNFLKQRRQKDIIQAAKNIFLHGDSKKATVEAIAKEAGISKATFYSYFQSKDELRSALLKEGVEMQLLSPPDNRSRILEAALKTFGERGFYGTTMEDVAAEAGITKGTIYWYFKNKEELFSGIIDRYSPLPTIVKFITEVTHLDDEEVLTQVATIFYEALEDRVDYFRVLFFEVQMFPQQAELVFTRYVSKLLGSFSYYLQQKMAKGEFNKREPFLTTQAFFGTFILHFLAKRIISEHLPLSFSKEQVIQEFVHLFLWGVKGKRN